MAVNGKHFTFIWNVKNFSFSLNTKRFRSPSFSVDTMGGTEWNLILKNNKEDVSCQIQRLNDSGPDEFHLDYELSFLTGDGCVLRSEIFIGKGYKKSYIDSHSALCVERDEILKHNTDLFIPDDTLTIRCRMWDSNETILQSGRCFAETLIETECRSFVGTIDKFSSTEPNRKNLVCIQPSSMKNFFSSMKFCVAADGKLELEMKPLDYDHLYKYKCKIFIRDAFGNKVKSGQGEFYDTKSQCIPLTLPKEHLMENKGYYLPNDVLTIECEIIFPTGEIKEKLDEPEYGFEHKDPREMMSNVVKNFFCLKEHQTESLTALKDDYIENEVIFPTNNPIENIDEHEPENGCVCNDTQSIIIDPKDTSIFSEENLAESFSTLKDDWISLFNEGISCDTELKTTTETFRVHKAVLIARSPVFKSMFTTDMAEKASNCVEIDDLDDHTVRRMLKFMYSDTLDSLEYESAKNLYFSSDKYDIVSLRYRCSNFLKQNFLQSKCCEILLLADKHEDTDLKNVVKDYIAKNGEEILSPEEWENLEKNHSLLAIEVLRAINRMKTQET